MLVRDVLVAEQALVLVAGAACALGVDANHVEVVRVGVARVAGQRLDAVQLGDRLVVHRELAPSDLSVALDLVQLDERDRREHVGEVRLVAGDDDVVEGAVAAAHQAQVLDRLRDLRVVRRDEAALAGGDVLRRVEGEAGGLCDRADLAPAVPALRCVRRVLDERDAVREERVEIGRLAGKVDGDDRLGPRR